MAEDPFAAIAEPASAPGADPFADIAEPATGDQFARNAASVKEQNENAGAKTPGFFKQLIAPYNPGAEDLNPVLRTLDAAGGALLSTGPAVYHAFADEPTPEENEKFKGDTGGLKRVGLGIHRMVVDPVVSAAQDYASGKVTPKAALGVLPEALGVGIGSQTAAELGGRALDTVKPPKSLGELRTQMKEGVQPTARRVTDVESGTKEAVTKAAEGYGEDLAKNKEARRDVFKENMRKQAQANFDIGREKVQVAEKNKAIEAENQASEAEVAKRKVAEKLVDTQSHQLGEKLSEVEQSVRKSADAKFDAVRAKIGNPETDPAPLIDAVNNVEENILQGIPENIKEFRSILGHGGEAPEGLGAAFEEVTGEAPEGALPITWDKLQSLKSRIDARLRSRGRINGDLKRGLYSMQDVIVDTMGDLAKDKGAEALWDDARQTWRQYKEDFHEGTGKAGSPVARAREGVDPADIRQPFLGRSRSTLKNRGVEILRKYPQHGGNEAATLAEQLVKDHDTMSALPKKATVKALKEPSQVHDMPARKAAPPVPEAPTVDVQKVARELIAKKAKNWANFNARDIGILGSSVLAGTLMHLLGARGLEAPTMAIAYEGMKYGSGRLLNNPKVIDWLSKTPAEEAAALSKIPGADKIRIVEGLTDLAIKSGKPVKLSPAAATLIGPANVARIAAATGSVAATRVQNRKDALDLLNTQ